MTGTSLKYEEPNKGRVTNSATAGTGDTRHLQRDNSNVISRSFSMSCCWPYDRAYDRPVTIMFNY